MGQGDGMELTLLELGSIGAIINGILIQPLWLYLWLVSEKIEKKKDTKWW